MLQVFYLHMFQLIYTYVASAYSKCFICFRRMMQVFYLDVVYVAVAIHICCKRMLQMFHTYVLEVLHVTILVDAGSGHMRRRSRGFSGPHISDKRSGREWSPPACASTGTRCTTGCADAPACRGRCAGTKLHAGQAGQTFF